MLFILFTLVNASDTQSNHSDIRISKNHKELGLKLPTKKAAPIDLIEYNQENECEDSESDLIPTLFHKNTGLLNFISTYLYSQKSSLLSVILDHKITIPLYILFQSIKVFI